MCDKRVAQLGKERKMESCTDEGCRGSNSDKGQRHIKLMLRTVAFSGRAKENLDI